MDVVVGYTQQQPSPLSLSKDGKLVYTVDSLGNRIPDFSYAGYQGGNHSIPFVEAKVSVPLISGDATAGIQAAIDYVASLPVDKNGFRGAVQLLEGEYHVAGTLKLHTSGVVLRGTGFGSRGTTVTGTGTMRHTLVRMVGKADLQLGDSLRVNSSYVPVGAMKLNVADATSLKVGDKVFITRPSTQEWIAAIGTAHFGGGITSLGWKPGQRDVVWDRTIVAVKGSEIELDAPLTTALDKNYGTAIVQRYTWAGRIENVGIENINLRSTFDVENPKDEDHRWMAVTVENTANAWIRRIQFAHFAGSAVYLLESAKKVTVEDCISLAPVSEIGGQRRHTFYTKGQQTLFQRCYAEQGYHDFAVGYLSAGPNAFVQCQAIEPFNFSGAIDSWASGILFDIIDIDAQALSYKNRGQDGQGAGWTAANSVFWQSTAALVECYQPPTAQNWAFGTWAQFQGDGYWDKSNEYIKPRSLYYAQLQDRLGKEANERAVLLPLSTDASSSPPVSVAMELTAQAAQPVLQLKDFILDVQNRTPLVTRTEGIRSVDLANLQQAVHVPAKDKMAVVNGWLQRGDKVLVGGKTDVQWWTGSSRRHGLAKSRPHITRFVPGEIGLGLTDDLEKATDGMIADHILALDHNYGLWYDRRRDDHERIRRIDGDVWPPFYELPFARSGQGVAYDGLSKYDLTKYNQFYWGRLKEFADIADEKGLVLFHQNYFQHNILEAGAHYAEFPWRTANNINQVGFPEPVPYAGDKRIFMAEQFYDTNHPVRRELHRAYIRQCLDNFKNNSSVIQFISAEYTGPLHFTQFWIDVINEWKNEKGVDPIIALSTTKDVQDAILADPARADAVQVIDIRYWHYQADGTVYAPEGGQNLAPRQHARLLKPKKTSAEQVYRAVSEYKSRFPEKAVIYNGDNYPSMAWAIFMAGGSMAAVPSVGDGSFYKAAAQMTPKTIDGVWVLEGKNGAILYNVTVAKAKALLKDYKGNYKVQSIQPGSGKVLHSEKVNFGKGSVPVKFTDSAAVIWIAK